MILVIADHCPCPLSAPLSELDPAVTCLVARGPRFHVTLTSVLQETGLDLVVLEGFLQTKQCFELLKIFKVSRPEVPVLFLLPTASDQSAGELLSRGARCCLQSPFDHGHLKDCIGMLLRLKRETRELRVPVSFPDSRATGIPAGSGAIPEPILRAISYAEHHATDRDLSVGRLARIACLSPYHFCRAFKKFTSKTPMQYVLHVRIERAKQFLGGRPEDMTVAMVANALGFCDSSTFNKHFKKITGHTPTGYKQLTRQAKAGSEQSETMI
jgi:AraC-like DNA-binding protein